MHPAGYAALPADAGAADDGAPTKGAGFRTEATEMRFAHMTAGGSPVKLSGCDLASRLRDLPKKRRALLKRAQARGQAELSGSRGLAVASTASAGAMINGGATPRSVRSAA